jgi:hypothetical protein
MPITDCRAHASLCNPTNNQDLVLTQAGRDAVGMLASVNRKIGASGHDLRIVDHSFQPKGLALGGHPKMWGYSAVGADKGAATSARKEKGGMDGRCATVPFSSGIVRFLTE